MTQNFDITEAASKRLKEIIEIDKLDPTSMLRLSILGGGCSGFQYNMDFDTTKNSDDHVFEKDGAVVVIDETSLDLLGGSQLNFIENLTTKQFIVENPNASSSCGCGSSFAV